MAVYAVETITNLHVGDMGASFNVVDKTVQRDVLTNFPTIYASSMKGALRSAAETRGMTPDRIKSIFGGEGKDISKGLLSFNDARLLFYPVRSADRAYYLATCPTMLKDCARLLKLCGNEECAQVLDNLSVRTVNKGYGRDYAVSRMLAEEWLLPREACPELADLMARFVEGESHLALLSYERMKQLMESLPVIARNQLDNGISKNLWYEQMVPRKSVFLLGITGKKELCDALHEELLQATDANPIQIGANATVGYGLCQFRLV